MYDLNNKLSFNSPISKMNKEYNQKELNSIMKINITTRLRLILKKLS